MKDLNQQVDEKLKTFKFTNKSLGELEFNSPSLLMYRSYFKKQQLQENGESLDYLFQNCVIKKKDYDIFDTIPYMDNITSEFLDFHLVDVSLKGENFLIEIYNKTSEINETADPILLKSLVIKRPSRAELMNLINLLSSNGGMLAWEYCYNKLKKSGDSFNQKDFNDLLMFVSCNRIANVIIYHKDLDLKKK